jgi:hypothetical protein
MVDAFADPDFDGVETGTIVSAVQFEKNQTKSSAAKEYLRLYENKHFPGLGYVKNDVT